MTINPSWHSIMDLNTSNLSIGWLQSVGNYNIIVFPKEIQAPKPEYWDEQTKKSWYNWEIVSLCHVVNVKRYKNTSWRGWISLKNYLEKLLYFLNLPSWNHYLVIPNKSAKSL